MSRRLKHVRLFEGFHSHLADKMVEAFPRLTDFQEDPQTVFNVWLHLATPQDTDQIRELIDAGLFNTAEVSKDFVQSLPGADGIVLIENGTDDFGPVQGKLLNQICPGIVVVIDDGRPRDRWNFDMDHLRDINPVGEFKDANLRSIKVATAKILAGYPVLFTQSNYGAIRIWFNTAELDRVTPDLDWANSENLSSGS